MNPQQRKSTMIEDKKFVNKNQDDLLVDAPPHDDKAERSVIGVSLSDAFAAEDLISMLRPSDFYSSRFQNIFQCITDLKKAGIPIDPLTVGSELSVRKQLDDIGGYSELAGLISDSTSLMSRYNVDYHAKIVRKKSVQRDLMVKLYELYGICSNGFHTDEFFRKLEELNQACQNGGGDIFSNDIGIGKTSSWQDLDKVLGPIVWEWASWLARGFVHILASEAGQGKSNLALRIGSCFIQRVTWPDGTHFNGESGSILWCEAESAQALNLARAKAWNLPLDKIINPFGNPLSEIKLDDAVERGSLLRAAKMDEVKFIVVDSLSGSHSREEKDSTKMQEILKFLAPLARDLNKAVLVTHHLRKQQVTDKADEITLDRVRGSTAIGQIPRIIWALDQPDPEQKELKRLSVIKNNLAVFPKPLGLKIGDTGLTFSNDAPKAPRAETLQDRAGDLLFSILSEGPKSAGYIREQIDGAGLSWDAAKRAKAKLGIVSVKKVDPSTGKDYWLWSLKSVHTDAPLHSCTLEPF